jgi:hypothetical protein
MWIEDIFSLLKTRELSLQFFFDKASGVFSQKFIDRILIINYTSHPGVP